MKYYNTLLLALAALAHGYVSVVPVALSATVMVAVLYYLFKLPATRNAVSGLF